MGTEFHSAFNRHSRNGLQSFFGKRSPRVKEIMEQPNTQRLITTAMLDTCISYSVVTRKHQPRRLLPNRFGRDLALTPNACVPRCYLRTPFGCSTLYLICCFTQENCVRYCHHYVLVNMTANNTSSKLDFRQ